MLLFILVGNLEPSTSSASSSPCGEIEDGDDGDTTVKPEDMEQDEFYEESNCDEEEEWSEDSLLDEVKSEQEEEDDEELSDDVEDDEEDGIDIPENDPLEGVGDHAASKPGRDWIKLNLSAYNPSSFLV